MPLAFPTTGAWRYLEVGDIIPHDAWYNSGGMGRWEHVRDLGNYTPNECEAGNPLPYGRVEFIEPLRTSPRGNKLYMSLEL